MTASSSDEGPAALNDFLRPFHVDVDTCHALSQRFADNFAYLAAESQDQFLPTPISQSILRPIADHGQGRHLAIDIGGTNLRVGFVELLAAKQSQEEANGVSVNGNSNGHSSGQTNGHSNGHQQQERAPSGRIRRHLEKSWSISNHLKNDNADSLFLWIGKCIAEVVAQGRQAFNIPSDEPLPLGVTFSFPTDQHSLSEATITSMGKGFAIPPDVELGARLQHGYDKFKTEDLPPIRVAAIANDSVSTLVSFIFNFDGAAHRRATMGLILGTGSNATVPLRLNSLHPTKQQQKVSVLPGEKAEDVKIAVNTEWSINGTAAPMREMGLITRWDDALSAQNERPGFQPLEYMTAGRYLGELGRMMMLSYLTETLGLPAETLPSMLLERHSLTTTFLSHFKPLEPAVLVAKLKAEFLEPTGFAWTERFAEALYHIAKAIELRAAGIIAAAVIALLTVAEELPAHGSAMQDPSVTELGVGYTGGCIVHFQDYLADCQQFVDALMRKRFGDKTPLRVALSPCHDGGITGAGILVAAAMSSKKLET
ncbi:hypothetical protein JDV02_007768 [Purpureocillium takamizusanense]|uniref:Phosphotransferase n=1 Tax=Purpureocillium takamizusanense TaxID=2060973 RepID=A0A9Q8VEH0_9HYPO|nr:uncharacterized protein JDV02_007768 [Purpureocillium takamizusanense]UNI21812.1 hypothetical protein JDV02_007768 [Purpureocillium takamizusanense]